MMTTGGRSLLQSNKHDGMTHLAQATSQGLPPILSAEKRTSSLPGHSEGNISTSQPIADVSRRISGAFSPVSHFNKSWSRHLINRIADLQAQLSSN
jgi:hypothetical protein